MAVSVLGAVLMELIRWYGRTRGDIALAMLFYGGMAGGVMFINLAPGGSNANLMSYLFGSLSTVSAGGRDRDLRARGVRASWSRWACAGSCSRSVRTRSSRG